VYFAGGIALNGPTSIIEIFNSNNKSWSIMQLSSARHSVAVILVGTTIYFAGGSLSSDSTSPLETAVIDILDTFSQNWTTFSLSSPRSSMSAHFVGQKLIFAGGYSAGLSSSKVDILDMSSKVFTLSQMRSARADVSAVSTETLLIFYSGAVATITSSLDIVFAANSQIEFWNFLDIFSYNKPILINCESDTFATTASTVVTVIGRGIGLLDVSSRLRFF